MSKEFKEKYERVCQIKDRAISLVETQLNGNIENVDAKELGEVADIAKDMAELMELCAEAEYYHAITEAMEENSKEENLKQMDKYLPESRFYGGGMPPIVYAGGGMNGNGGSSGRTGGSNAGRGGSRYYQNPTIYNPMDMWQEEDYINSMQHSPMNRDNRSRDMREGKSGITRRTYMEMKEKGADKTSKTEEIKKYAHELTDDLAEMLENASPEEKSAMKQHLMTFVNRIQ